MNAFLLLYALAISLELVLSLLMAVFLFLIAAPVRPAHIEQSRPGAPARRPLARTARGALVDAFAVVSEQRDDLPAIINARAVLVAYRRAASVPRRAPEN
jgi:hypothetical protein